MTLGACGLEDLGYDVAISRAAAEAKGLRDSQVAGQADLILFPNIEAGNATVKSWKVHGQARASIVLGASVPVLLNLPVGRIKATGTGTHPCAGRDCRIGHPRNIAMTIRTVGVVGAGQMGNGIAQVFAQAGFEVLLNDISQTGLDDALTRIDRNLERQVAKKALSSEDKSAIIGRIRTTLVLAGCSSLI